MGGYDLDEYDDYEDEGEYQEQEIGEYEEEEDRLPTKEELEYLELRQKLKEKHRKKMLKDQGSGLANLHNGKSKMPYDNFGSFFGPSQPVIAQRVIQESKSLLENPHLVERIAKPKNGQNKGGSSIPAGSNHRSNGQPQKVDNWAKPKAKIQMLKNTRDYSFLLSDDADLPAPTKNPPKSVSAPKPEAHLSPRPPNNSGRKVVNGHEERRPLPTSSQMRVKAGPPSQRPNTTSKVTSTSVDSRKQFGRNEGSGPGRPSTSKALPPKMPMASKQKVISPPVARGSISGGNKPLPSRPLNATQKKPLEPKRDVRGSEHRRDDRGTDHRRDDRGSDHRRDDRGSNHRRDDRGFEHRRDDRGSENRRDDRGSIKGNMIRKSVVSSKLQIKQQPAKLPSSAQQKERLHKRPVRPYDDDDDDEGEKAISMIRNMFGYNPNRYRGVNDNDDSDMEAGFDDIMEEEYYSEKIAAKEDEEELKKIEEEERREKMRRAAKKQKLSRR